MQSTVGAHDHETHERNIFRIKKSIKERFDKEGIDISKEFVPGKIKYPTVVIVPGIGGPIGTPNVNEIFKLVSKATCSGVPFTPFTCTPLNPLIPGDPIGIITEVSLQLQSITHKFHN